MTARILDFIRDGRWYRWLTGPILEKELLSASRRRRNYVLRSVYLLLLTIILSLIIAETYSYSSNANQPWQFARLARFGREIVLAITWFQFLALQLVTLVLLSTSISDEIYRRTLGTLMTTPVTSLQIVMGKLLGRLVQLLLMLALSVPLLILLRVFGGIPWQYELAAVAVTLTAVLFAASITMLFSIFNRRAYVVMLATLATLAAVFILIPWGVGYVMYESGMNEMRIMTSLAQVNPYMMLAILTEELMNPRMMRGMEAFWFRHCCIMLAASAAVIAACVTCVRRAAYSQIAGIPFTFRRKAPAVPAGPAAAADRGRVRRVAGAPVLWRELRQPFIRGPRKRIALTVLAVATLLATYLLAGREMQYRDSHTVYVAILTVLGMLVTATVSATSITTEKEAETLSLLLTTTQTSGEIITGKFVGALRRCLPAWGLLAVHILVFAPFGYVAFFVPALLGLVVAGALLFHTGTGLFFSVLFKRTTTAVVANLLLGIGLWGLAPLLVALAAEATHSWREAESLSYCHPVVHACTVADAGLSPQNTYWQNQGFSWPCEHLGLGATTSIIFGFSSLYALVGVGAAALAAQALRRKGG